MRLQVKVMKGVITAAFFGLALMIGLPIAAQDEPEVTEVTATYDFEPDTGTFTSIRDTGMRADGRTFVPGDISTKDGNLERITIPFEFYFFGRRISTLVPTTNFFLSANPRYSCTSSMLSGSCRSIEESKLSTTDRFGFGNLDHQGGIYPFWTDTIYNTAAGARVLYELSGNPGNQVMTIEFSQLPLSRDSATLNSLSAQVKLYENDGSIEFIYQQGNDAPTSTYPAFVGIAATAEFNTESTTTRYYSVQSLDTPALTENEDSNFQVFPMNRSNNVRPQTGQVFRFTPDFYLPHPPNLSVAVDTNFSYTLPEAIYPTGAVTYALTGGLPTGFSFVDDNDTPRRISGMSSDTVNPTTLTYTATDDLGDADIATSAMVSQTFTFAVTANTSPDLSSGSIFAIFIVQNTESLTLIPYPIATGGNAPLTYSLSPDLPAGLFFNAESRLIYGISSESIPTTPYVYTVTDSDGQTDTLNFNITVTSQVTAPIPSQDFVFVAGEEVNETLNAFNGGRGTLTYALMPSPDLPPGLVFTAGSRLISETPTDDETDNMFRQETYTYTATDNVGVSATKTFTIEVVDAMPVAPVPLVRDEVFIVGEEITVILPEFTTTVDANTKVTAPQLMHTLTDGTDPIDDDTNALIAGLEWDPGNRRISGTPNAVVAATEYTYTATEGGDSESVSVTFTITTRDTTLTRPTVSPLVFTPGQMDASNTLPAFTGGTGGTNGLTHSLSDGTNTNTGLLGGLSFDPATRIITVPATSGDDSLDATPFTYAATDAVGERASVMFTITIEDDEPAFASNANISDFTGIVGVEITPVPLPVVETAGTGETTYHFFIGGTETELPDGLRVNNDNQIVGEPTTELVTTTYMYTARDTDGDTDSIEFTITVEADTVPVAPDPLPFFTFTVRQNLDTIPGVNNFEGINNRLAFSGGNPPLMYAFADNTTFPDGLTLTLHETRAALIGDFNGTDMDDSTMDGPLEFTYTATDRNDDPVNSTFTLTLIDPLPMVPDEFEPVHEFVPGDDVAVTLPDFEGGNTPLAYSLTDASGTVLDGSTDLTAGLEYTPADSMIAGMIAVDTEDVDDSVGIVTYTYTATDVDMDAAPAEFTIEVIDPRPQLPEVIQSNYAFISDDPVPSDTLPDFRYINITGGVDPTLTYTLSNDSNLPMGLGFNAATGKISGTPTENTVGNPPSFTITARDGTDSASYPFTITVTDDLVPEPPTITDGGYTFRVGEILPLTSTGTGREPLVLPVFTVQYDDDSSTLAHRLANEDGVTIDNGTVSLIGGLEYNQETRTISGTVEGNLANEAEFMAIYNYEATETDAPTGQDNDMSEPFTFTITIVDEMPSFTGITIDPDPIPAIEDFLFTTAPLPEVVKNTEVPPEPIGTGMITYSVTDADGNPHPSWLMFNMDSRVLSGTPDAVLTGDDSMFRYTATDEDLDTASIDFTIDVEAADEPEVPVSYEEVLYLEPGDVLLGATIVDLPEFTGGNGMLMYDLLDDDDNPVDRFLSGRLTFTSSTREIMGTLADDEDGDDSDSATYTYIATDVDGSTATTPFTIEVIDARPVAPDGPIANVVVRPGMNVETGKTLPPFGFGDSIPQDSGISEPVLTYSLTDNKPSWLSIHETTRVLSGMAPDEVSSVEVTYMATDGADTDTTTFTLIVTPDIPQPPEILPFTFSVGMVVDETLPPFTGGDGILDYSIVQGNNLVGGLTFDPAADARTISGTVTISGGNIPPTATYMYMAVDAEGDPNMVSFTITIEANVIPVAPTPPQMLTFAPGEQNASMTLEPFTSGNGILTYSATTAVVEDVLADFGLTFEPTTRVISGNISIADDSDPNNKAITYTYTATDRDGSTADANFTIAVVDNAPMIPTGPAQEFFVPVGEDVTVTLAPFTGSDEPFTYAIDTTTRDLPEGLNLGPAPGPGNLVISGNIMDGAGDDGDSESVTYTYTATDSVGDSTSATFTIWVVDVRPEAPTQEEIGEFRISSGESFTAINGTLPEFGNNIPEGSNIAEPMFDYTLDESLTWLTFTPSTRRLEGEAPATASSTEVTYSVTYGPDTDSVTFNIVVTNDPAPEVTEDLMELVFLPGDTVNAENGMLPEFMISDDSILMYNIYLPTDTDLENPITNLVIDTTTLSFDSTPANRVLSGEIMATSGDDTATANFIYAATDSDPVAPPAEGDGPDTTPDPFTITIVDDIPDFTGESINNITVTANSAFPPVTLPDTEGTRTVTYTLARSDGMPFPDWLTFQNDLDMADPLLLSGTAPSVVPDPASIAFTYSAIDEDLDTTTPLTFTITIEANEMPVAPTTQELIFVPGQQNVSRTLEPFTGGNEPFTYSSDDVQAVFNNFGLTFNPATRTIMGDINVADDSDPNNKDAITYTYTATDRDGEPTNANFTIEVVDNIPMAPTGPQDFFVPVGSPVTVTLAPFTGSDRAPPPNDAFTYTIDTNILSLPTGLSLGEGANNLVISGTIVDTAGDDGNSEPLTYTYIATGSGGDSESATFTIQVIDARPVVVDVPDVEFTVNVRRTIVFPEFGNNIPDDLPQDANIPVPTFNYNINQIDELPEDGTTSFNGRTLSVLVTRFFEYDFLFTYRALEVDGEDSATANFMITIVVDPAPKVTEDLMELVFLPGDTVDAENGMLPEFMISDGSELMYNIYLESDMDLENPITDLVIDTTTTLRFDPDTTNPVLTGTIPATSGDDAATANFIYAATDSDPVAPPAEGDGPDTTPDPFTITIVDDMPDFTGESINNITVTANSAFPPVTLPDTEGTRTVTYTLARSDGMPFPDWLTFQNDPDMANPLLLSGTAPAEVPDPASIPFTYSAMDEDGDTTPIPLTFTITVEADEVPVAPDPKPSFPFTVGEDISLVTGVDPATALAFTPGDGATTYTVPTPTLPEGLSFNTSTAALTGTPEGTPRPDGFVDRVYTYTATDEDGDAVESTFTITLIDPLPIAPTPPDFTFTVREPISSISGGVEPLAFVDGSGNGDLMYALAADTDTTEFSERGLTLTLDADTAALSGTFNGTAMNDATDDGLPLVVTYTATDEDGDAVNSTFTLTLIDPLPTLPAIDNLVYEVGQTILTPSVTLPMSPGGNAPLSYRLRNAAGQMDNGAVPFALIEGFVYAPSPSTRVISGTVGIDTAADQNVPATNVAAPEYTFIVTDADGDIATETFTIRVVDSIPVAPVVRNRSFSISRQITPVVLTAFATTTDPTPNPDLTHSLIHDDGVVIDDTTNELLPGLMWNPDTRTISGTPTELTVDSDNNNDPIDITYRATDGFDSATETFTISVVSDSVPDISAIEEGYIFNVGVDPMLALPESEGGDGVIVYSLFLSSDTGMTPLTTLADPPSPLSAFTFDPDPVSGPPTISGTFAGTDEDDSVSAVMYTYTATDVDTEFDSEPFTITINDEMPEFANGAMITNITGVVNTAITTVTLPPVETAGSVSTTYSLLNAEGNAVTELIDGLTFNPDDRVLAGTPRASLAGTYTYTATDADGDTATIPFTITITNEMPNFGPRTINNISVTVGMDFTTVTLPAVVTDGTGTTTYSLEALDGNGDPLPQLPYGLSFNRTSRMLSGTRTLTADDAGLTNVAVTDLRYTAMDEDGDSTPALTFTITITDEVPMFASNQQPPPPITGTVDTLLPPVTLPAVETDGTGMTTYSLSPDITVRAPGLTFASDTRVIAGTPTAPLTTNNTFSYTAMDENGDSTPALTFTITIQPVGDPVDIPIVAPTVMDFTFAAGDTVAASPATTLPVFTGGNDGLTYSLALSSESEPRTSVTDLVGGLEFDPSNRQITGTVRETNGNDSVMATEYTYSATDGDGDTATATFTITITDDYLMPPADPQEFSFEPGEMVSVTLDPHTGGPGDPITYALITTTTPALPGDLALNRTSRVISGTLPDSTMAETTYTYRATSGNEMHDHTFTIAITDAPSLEMATASAIPTVGANIALVASQAISSRVELALNGLSSGIDIRTLDGPQLRLNPQQQNGGSGSPVRFGVWYSAASDSLSDSRGDVAWDGTTDSTNLGFDVGFDISASASLVVGILQNSSSTSATYRNSSGSGGDGTLSVDLDSTAFYVGLGYDWLDAWFANGSADSTLNDSVTMMAIPASFSYQTIGLTASFEVAESFSIGGKVESLTSDLSLAAMADDEYMGLSTDSSQLRTAFVANYQLKLGENGNGLLIPKFEFGFRDLSLGSSIQENFTAAGGSAMETGFGIDYLQRAWGLTVGLDIRSISVENYSSDSTQYQIRWESGNYGNGLSFQLTPHSVSETLGGIDSLYSGGYNQYQSVLERQRGGNSTQDSKGLDFEVGYGFVASYGTVTPYLKTTNYRGSGNRAQEFGIRYQTLSGLELTLRAERELTPQTIQILGFPLTFMQDENALTFNTRYSF